MQRQAGEPEKSSAKTALTGPEINANFVKELDQLVALARQGQPQHSPYFNPSNDWLVSRMPIFQEMSEQQKADVLKEAEAIARQAGEANAAGKAATRAWPGVVVRLDSGGLGFFSQLGVVRRPDLTQYFVDGFDRNRDSLAFSEENQALFAEVFSCISAKMRQCFGSGNTIIQSDRRVADAPGRSFHARQLLFGDKYLQVPIMWRQLTFDLPDGNRAREPEILEVSIPHWLEDLDMPQELKERVRQAGLTQLVFKAPTRGLSLHLGFDYVGEHKMGPLSIAMFLVKQNNGLAVQAALSMARAKTLDGQIKNTAMVTVGPSLHGKSTITIMLELANSNLARLLGLSTDPEEGIYPMNDDIVLLQKLAQPVELSRDGTRIKITHGIDGTENNLYAMPYGLTREDDPITYDVVRGTPEAPNPQETLENVPVDPATGRPDYLQNPVRNMRMILSRPRLLERKGSQHLLKAMTDGQLSEAVHVPMEHTHRVFWQAVMRQNTVIPPLRRLTMEQYIRTLMYGEAVQMGAATGAIGRPYVEYFSDPFIIGLEDDNANLLYSILQQLEQGGLRQEYYIFNTGGIGADSNDEASGEKYRKIPRDLTLMLEEALLRGALLFEYEPVLGSDNAVAIVDRTGKEVLDLRQDWLPRRVYGDQDYVQRVDALKRRRYYGRDANDKAGILRYTRAVNALIGVDDIPEPANERELAWLLSFYWNVDQAYNSLTELEQHLTDDIERPGAELLAAIQQKCRAGMARDLELSREAQNVLTHMRILPA